MLANVKNALPPSTRAALRSVRNKFEPGWRGHCPICAKSVKFRALGSWYRDQLICSGCNSIPRERALMQVLQTLYPDWRNLDIHESSPAERGVSVKLRRECRRYVASQYDTSITFGACHASREYRSEDLERQTFGDRCFDIVVTQDVFEHLFRPELAIKEIERTLRPGGAHIMTVPIVNKDRPSRRRASRENGQITHHVEPSYHRNPIDPNGSLVTVDWGYDIADYLDFHSGMSTTIHSIDNRPLGICAEYIEVVVSRKRAASVLSRV